MINDNHIFKNRLDEFYSGKLSLTDSYMYNKLPISIVDDYTGDAKIHSLENVKFCYAPEGSSWTVHPVAVHDNKIVNISHKCLSYFSIINPPYTHGELLIRNVYNHLQTPGDFEVVEEPVFQFFDCFPYAPVHNLDDMYNLLYLHQKNNLNCKLLVPDTDNFYFNQSLFSLAKHFGLQYMKLKPTVKYLFKDFKCARQYHWAQSDALKWLYENYIKKICREYEGYPTHDNISILKIAHKTNASTVDVFQMTDSYEKLEKEKNVFNVNTLRDDLEYKIYVVNNAKNIIASFESPYKVNIHKHCYDTSNKKFMVINGGYTRDIYSQFIPQGEGSYDFYGSQINGYVTERISLDEVEKHLWF